MKILHVNITNYGGGVEQYLHQLFIELSKKGHQNIFLYGENNKKIIKLPDVRYFFLENIAHVQCKSFYSKLEYVKKIIKKYKPNLVYIHQVLNSRLIDYLTRTLPSIRFVHGFKMVCPEGKKMLESVNQHCDYSLNYGCQRRAFYYRCMCRNFFLGIPLIYNSKKICQIHKKRSLMIVASNFMKSVLINNGFNEKKIKVIPYFTYLPKINHFRQSNNTVNILALGRLVKIKGMHYILNAFKNVKENAFLTIVGDGPELKRLKELAVLFNLTSKVTFLGWISHEKLDLIFRKSDIVVVPSVWPEPFGIVGIEAMSYQKPVIAFNVGGISEWCKDKKTGYLIENKNYKELSEKVKVLLRRHDISIKMGKKGRLEVEKHFTPEIHLSKLIPLFEQIIR